MEGTRKQDGVVLVELTLVLPWLLLLTLGFLQFGMAMNAKIDSTHLTAEGARYIAVNQNPGLADPAIGTMAAYIRSRGDTEDLRDEAVVCIEYPLNPETNTSRKVGDPVRVRMFYDYDMVPGVGGLIDAATLAVESEATMRLEAVPTKINAVACPA